LSIVNGFILDSTIDGIRFSTRPDRLPIEMLDVYRRLGVSTIEIGAQSFKDSVLRFIKRNHTAQDVRDAVYRLKEHGFRTSIHLMLGLPSSSHNDDIYSIEETIKLQPDYVRLHPTLVLKDTELEELYRSGKYTPLSLSEAIKILKYALKRFSESNIRVIRVGLHNDDNLVNPETIVAGPFHPSLRELALSSHSNSKIEQT
jgi:histone acetyltransferase (RNA polymerase elongator complex component)